MKLSDGLECNHCHKVTDWYDVKVYGYSIPEVLAMEAFWRCNNLHRPLEKPQSDTVEAIVQELLSMTNPTKPTGPYVPSWFEKKLRELVSLARAK